MRNGKAVMPTESRETEHSLLPAASRATSLHGVASNWWLGRGWGVAWRHRTNQWTGCLQNEVVHLKGGSRSIRIYMGAGEHVF